MRNIFLFLGKTRESFLAQGIEEFIGRLKRYAPVEIKIIREKKGAGSGIPADELKREEGRLLVNHINRPTLVVALDQGGRRMTSLEFAEQLIQWENQGQKTITFLIGGPNGLSDDILETSDLVISLSAMTFTHEMARLLILEQLYRAYTIKAGTGYHK